MLNQAGLTLHLDWSLKRNPICFAQEVIRVLENADFELTVFLNRQIHGPYRLLISPFTTLGPNIHDFKQRRVNIIVKSKETRILLR